MKRAYIVLAILAVACSATAQPPDVSSQPVPGLVGPNDIAAAASIAVTDRALAKRVQDCYFKTARQYPIGSTDSASGVAFCAAMDMGGIIIGRSEPSGTRNAYFASPGAENRIGTELISFAGLNTYQAYLTINWLRSALTPILMKDSHGAIAGD